MSSAWFAVGMVIGTVAGLWSGVMLERLAGVSVVATPDRWRLALNGACFALDAAARSLSRRAPDAAARCTFEARRLRAVADELP